MLQRRIALSIAFVLVAGCSNGGTSSTPTVAVANVAATSKLQFGVGVATIGTSTGTVIGTNFVSTLRGPDGHSAILTNTPTITGPSNFIIGFAGSPNSVTGVLPNVLSSAVLASQNSNVQFPASFSAGLGPLVGVFGYGMAADNLLSAQVATQLGVIDRNQTICQDLQSIPGDNVEATPQLQATGGILIAPYSNAQSRELGLPVGSGPLYPRDPLPRPDCLTDLNNSAGSSIGGSELPINYYGGPPAWPSAQGYNNPDFFVGYPLGFTDFPAKPVAGKYSLDVAYATNQTSTTYAHLDATATLATTAALAPLTISGAVIHKDGSGTVTLNVPPGLFETIVLVRGQSDCANPNGQVQRPNYAIVTHSAGPQSFVFASNLGPPDASGNPSQTFCTSTNDPNSIGGTAYAVGFDYPAYESSYPFDLTQTPKITNGDGHTGQADVTTSAPLNFTIGY